MFVQVQFSKAALRMFCYHGGFLLQRRTPYRHDVFDQPACLKLHQFLACQLILDTLDHRIEVVLLVDDVGQPDRRPQ